MPFWQFFSLRGQYIIWGQKVSFWQLFRKGQDGRALLVQPSRLPHRISKILFVLGSYEYLTRLEGKVRMLKYSKITVCQGNETYEPSPCLVSTSSWYVGFVVGVILRTQYPLLPVCARPCIFVILGNHAMRGHKL